MHKRKLYAKERDMKTERMCKRKVCENENDA